MLRVHSIETFGTHEGPGIRLVIFLQGCKFRCLYCHNPDTWAMDGGKELSAEDVLKLLHNQKEYFQQKGGLTVSGGEPLLQREALIDVFKKVKGAGFNTTLDTNGSILDEYTKQLLTYTDLVLLDVKHINPDVHFKLTQANNKITLTFAEYCEHHKKKMWLRYVLVPGHTDQTEFLHQWGKQFTQYTQIERVEILPYHTFGAYKYEKLGINNPLKNVEPASQADADKAQRIFNNYFSHVFIR